MIEAGSGNVDGCGKELPVEQLSQFSHARGEPQKTLYPFEYWMNPAPDMLYRAPIFYFRHYNNKSLSSPDKRNNIEPSPACNAPNTKAEGTRMVSEWSSRFPFHSGVRLRLCGAS
jgi:hypothetical protein